MRGSKLFRRDTKSRLIALVLSTIMALSGIPTIPARAAETAPAPGTITTVADLETLHRPIDIYGQNTLNAGKITVGKSVDTTGFDSNALDGVSVGNLQPDTNNFLVTLSQSAQAVGLASKLPVPIDAVFVLDTSGSMESPSNDPRYENMIDAANEAIASLLAANDQNRVAVVAFSSATYGEGTSKNAAANVLSELAHYDGDAATTHLQRVDAEGSADEDGIYVAGRKPESITITESQYVQTGTDRWGRPQYGWRDVQVAKAVNAFRRAEEGGTNIQAGVALGASLLMDSTKSTTAVVNGKTVTRLPFIIVLSDGNPTFSATASNWYDAASVAGAGEQGPGSAPYAGNGFLAAMTAAYYKSAITQRYFGENANENEHCNIYTVGVDLESDMDADETALAKITLNPTGEYKDTNSWYNTFRGYWNSYNAGRAFNINVGKYQNWVYSDSYFNITAASITASKNYVNGLNKDGESMFAGGLRYNDDYFDSDGDAESLNNTFKELVRLIQIKAISIPTDTSVSADFGGYVHFYDPIGEYMEVKDVHGIVADGHFFQGASFAKNMVNFGTENADAAFDAAITTALNGRLELSGSNALTSADIENIAELAMAAEGQLYYNSNDDFENSFCWWGAPYTDSNGDEHVQFLAFAEDDSIEGIEAAKAAGTIPAGAEYVCRSYYYYGAAGGAIEPIDDFLLLAIRVQRSLEAPYQETVYASIPGNLLSVDRVLITEDRTKSPVTYESFVQMENPVRIIYEVGLQSDINAQNVAQVLAGTDYVTEKTVDKSQGSKDNYEAAEDTYYFYTNDWDRTKLVSEHTRALAHAGFDVATDNDFYAFLEDTVLYTKNGNTYTPLTGDIQPGTTYYYERTYYDWAGERAKNPAGTIFDCTPEVEYIAVVAPSDADIIAAHTGTNSNGEKYVKAGTYTAYSLSAENDDIVKGENKTGTSTIIAHPMRTNHITDSHYTVFLGNNGRLALTADKVKTAQVTKADADNTVITDGDGAPVTVGDKITYTIKVVNGEDADTTATVTDTVPAGTKLVEGSIDNGGVYDEATGKITWTLSLAKDATTYVSFQAEVTEDALNEAVITINNTAFIKLSNTPEYTTNTTTNPPQGKKVEGADTNMNPEDGVKVGQELRYVIRWDNYTDQIADITITDVVPKGATILSDRISDNGTYDAASNKVTWTLEDVAPGAKGTVNFVVVVDESAKTPIINGATINIGPNDPGFVTNTTETEVSTGDLRINKTVTGTNGNQDRYFEVSLTTRSAQNENYGALDGTYTVEGSSKIQTIEFKDGKASFEIKHSETITIKELPAGLEVHVAETAASGYTATYSADDQKISIVPDNVVSVLITNTYAVEPTTFALKGRKTLNTISGQIGDTVFSFDAYPCDAEGNILGDVTNTAQVTVSTANSTEEFVFATKTITATGTSHYLVKEAHTNISGVTYDERQYLITVTVADSDDDGVLEVTQSTKYRDGDSGAFADINLTDDVLTFTNSYEPAEVELQLTGTKNLLGRELKANEFSFVVTENNVPVSGGIAAADGTITFETITYYKPGEHTYVVTEANGGDTTIDYDTTAYTVYVKVEDVGGHLTITEKTVNGSTSDAIVFNNAYKPGEAYINLSGTKNLYQGNLENDNTTPITLNGGEFSFVVDRTDSEGNVTAAGISTAHNGAGGSITFAPITVKVRDNVTADYEETLYFEVREAIPTVSKDPYMTYDATVYKVQVQVTYDYETGILSVGTPIVTGGNLEFNNIKYPDSITVQPQGTKTTQIAGGALPDDIYFSFAVKNVVTGNTVYTGIAEGSTTSSNIEFTTLTYSTPGTYKYWIAESNSGNTHNGITYDPNKYLMTVTITNTNGKLAASVQYFELNDGATVGSTNVDDYTTAVGTPSFTNEYDAAGYLNITAHKTFNLPMENDQFAFRLQRMASLDVDNDTTTGGLINGISDASGNVTFATLYYGIEDIPVGEDSTIIRYKMSEVIPTVNPIPGVTYDTNEYNVYVKLTHGLDGVIVAELCDANGNALATGATDTGITFNNNYVPVSGTTATMTATKELTGRDLALQDGEFTFNLYYVDSNNVETLVDSVENVGANITFTRNYPNTTAAGTYIYVIRELDGQKGGITYSTAEYWVQVTIEDDTTNAGLVTRSVKYFTDSTFATEITDLAAVKFTNSYEAQDITFTPEATKELTGRTLQDNEFYFQIVDMDSKAVVSIGTAYANGAVNFTPIHYGFDASITYPVAYEYTISEIKGSLGGVTYSDAVYYLKVTVSDDGAGKLGVTHGYYSDDSFATEITAQDIVFENTYRTGNGTAQLEATKKLAGRDLAAHEFDFVVVDENGDMVVSGDNDESVKANEESKILFGTIGYSFNDLNGATSREFTYWMYEVAPSGGAINGITFDLNRYKVVVTVEDEGNGILSTDVKYYSLNAGATVGSTNADDYTTLVIGTPSFENTYAPEPTEITLHAYKELLGKDLVDGEFSFVLKDEDNNEVTATNKDGVVSFVKEYTTIGTYEYTISEVQRVNSDKAGTGQYTFDETVYTVVVTVIDDGKGKLHATAEYFKPNSSDAVPGASFSNSYKPNEIKVDLSLDIDATKTVVGADGEEVEITVSGNKADYPVEGFQFAVKDALDNVVSTGTSNADGTITFTEFTFTQAGDYYYWISEADTDKPGITIDSQVWDLHIHIVNNYATGELEVGAVNTYLSNQGTTAVAPEFVNTYTPSDVNVTIKANKVLTGRALKENEFTFRLMEGDIIVAQSRNALNGEIVFDFTVNEPGTHTYEIMEVVPLSKDAGITYDETKVGIVGVKVVDDGSGQLKIDDNATVTINSGVEFTNAYKPAPTTAVVKASKLYENATLSADAFTFQLVDSNDQVVATAKNDAEGNIEFPELTLEEAGTVTYTIREQKGMDPRVTYDETSYKVTIEAIDDLAGHLYTEITYDTTNGEEPVFVNKYNPDDDDVEYKEFTITKKWLDDNNAKGLRPESITVRAYLNGVFVTDIVLSEENNWTASATWIASRGGEEYVWTIEEVNVPGGYVASYDQETLTVTNTLGGIPQTGDTSNVGLYMATSIMALAGVTVLGKRRKEEGESE